MNERNSLNICTGCGRQCPVGQFACGKGARLFGQMQDDRPEEQNGGEDRRESHGFHSHEKKHRHEQQMHHRHHRDHHDHHDHHDMGRWTEDSDALGVLLERCAGLSAKRSARGRGQQKILDILQTEECTTQRRLQELLQIQPGSMSELLTKLEMKGLVLREKSETDKRAVIVRITEAGRQAAGKHEESAGNGIFACLSEEEQQTLRTLLKKLLAQ